MAKMLIAAFDNQADANRALDELDDYGYGRDDISVISKSNEYRDEGYATGDTVARSAGSGAATGGVIGGLAGLLAGAGVFPALAGLFIGGPIAAALGLAGAAATTASGAVTGAAAGGLIGALTGLGLSRETAEDYDQAVSRGGVVLGVNGNQEQLDEARQVFEECGARDVHMVTPREHTESERAEDRSGDVRFKPEPSFGERVDRDVDRNDV